MNLKLKTLSLFFTLLLFSFATAQTPPAERKAGEIMARFKKEPATVQVTDQRTNKPVDLKIGKSGLQFLIMRDLGGAAAM